MNKRRKDSGFSLAALVFFAAAASILAAAAVPAYKMQAKRELEKELIFRGQDYTRAIQKYQRKFGAYPSSVDQLIQTNGLRFLRKAYKDPITGKDFRLIRLNPDGSLAGSKLFVQNVNTQPLFGNTQPFGQPPQQQGSPQSGTQQQGQNQTAQSQQSLQSQQQPTSSTPQQSRQRIETLERLNTQLSTLEQDRARLFTTHFIPRDAGWSEILPKLNAMVQEAHVLNTQKGYTIDQTPQYGLYSVKITVPVQGTYSNVVNFIKDIENSETFFIIDSIDVRSGGTSGPNSSDIGLGLNIETFFHQ